MITFCNKWSRSGLHNRVWAYGLPGLSPWAALKPLGTAYFLSICTALATALFSAWNTCIEALTIFFYTLGLSAVTSYVITPAITIFYSNQLSCSIYCLLMGFIVTATHTGTVWATEFSIGEALTVHFQTFGLFASTASLFSLLSCHRLILLQFDFKG